MGRNSCQLWNTGLTVKCWCPWFCFRECGWESTPPLHTPPPRVPLLYGPEVGVLYGYLKGNHQAHAITTFCRGDNQSLL